VVVKSRGVAHMARPSNIISEMALLSPVVEKYACPANVASSSMSVREAYQALSSMRGARWRIRVPYGLENRAKIDMAA
jgi:hypothetical protein